jgi:RNA polymerase subunit RPABC4/transcription elongation factor Spt4
MVGYKHPCKYCDAFIPPDSNICPVCGKVNPMGPPRCPKCRVPTQKGWTRCGACGLSLEIACPSCKKPTFFGDYCDNCGARLNVVCPNPKCGAEQPPLNEKCIKCGKPLKAK